MLDYICSNPAFSSMREKKRVIMAPAHDPKLLRVLAHADRLGICTPLLAGSVKETYDSLKREYPGFNPKTIIETEDDRGAIEKAAAMISAGQADILMQGGLVPFDFCQTVLELVPIHAFSRREALVPFDFRQTVLESRNRLGKKSRCSFVSLLKMADQDRLIMVTDTYIHEFPDFSEKIVIAENAVKLANLLGIKTPKVAALAAIEYVNPNIASTVDAAALAKMSSRGQFGSAIIEGPLDIDCAVSRKAALRKGIDSQVTGCADIYLVPNIEAGSALSQTLAYFGKMELAGILMGTVKPVVVNLPFIRFEQKVAQIALAVMMAASQ